MTLMLMTIGVSADRPIYNIDTPAISTVAESITPYPVDGFITFPIIKSRSPSK